MLDRQATDRGNDPMIGRLLDDRYLVGERVARGGMATVYEATDTRLDRTVAVKVMHANLSEEFSARFRREAQAAARLSHQNVVAVFDQGVDDGTPFLVMELIEGETLRDLIRTDTPMPPDQVLATVWPILMALQAAHHAGMIHRDVKPENVLLSADGRVKVADFGLARAVNADTQHTNTGVLIGTVSYLSPELVVDGKSDARADVYAVGVIMYELLTGQKPHQASSPIQVAYKHVHEDIPAPSAVVPGIPDYVDALVARATARDAALRPTDAGVLLRQARQVRLALADGVVSDPELSADLTPHSAADLFADTGDRLPRTIIDPSQAPESIEPPTAEPVAAEPLAAGPVTAEPVAAEPTAESLAAEPAAGPHAAEPGAAADASGVQGHDDFPVGGYDVYDQENEPTSTIRAGSAPPADLWSPHDPTPASRHSASYQPVGNEAPHYQPLGQSDLEDLAPGSGPADAMTGSRFASADVDRSRRGPVALVAVVVTALIAGLAGWYFGFARYTSTPGVLNLTSAAAQTKLQQSDLKLRVSGRQYSETVPSGSIISTSPKAGDRVAKGGTISAVLSRGPERHAVPKVAGMSLNDAQDALIDSKLTQGQVRREYNARVPKESVIRADPKGGTMLRRDAAVDLVVSRGPKPVDVPDVTGKTAKAATDELTALGFKVQRGDGAFSDSVPRGRVISQDPAANGTLFRGDPITIVLSKGPSEVEVPAVGGMRLAEARRQLEALGFKVETQRHENYQGMNIVASTDPPARTVAPAESTITLTLF